MKNIFTLLCIAGLALSCKNESKPVEVTEDAVIETAQKNDGYVEMTGEFVYYADAAVLHTPSEVYAVVINEKMHELDDMAKAYKVEPTDYVTVQVRGVITPKPEGEEGWDNRFDIKEIIKVMASNKEKDVIKLGAE
ncbi:hypothetical protein [Mangrovimonas sp. TPBH4]|uniref:hypothetical protein n=1 Tax=Mangrovimonas sp. TPBH4 TaxID=1645914 RepID=UPI0006B3FD28|nr:hypothetical protein [Mangrovimonas sp. TPBH4]